jgi:hypothetical protein
LDDFELLEEAIRSRGAAAAFEFLIAKAREERKYRDVFSARVMQVRQRMGLPLIEVEPGVNLEGEERAAYENAVRDAARETGELFLAAGEIANAWPYFRAIGETAPVAAAIENAPPETPAEALIDIAFREQVNPRKGFELILEHRGTCNAITWFGSMPAGDSRRECLRLLLRTLYDELVAALRSHIERAEGSAPATSNVAELIEGRDWLFEGNNYHVDTTHLTSVLRFSPELDDHASMRLALEIADYGTRLAPMYHFRGDPPFEDPYTDHGIYLRTLLGDDVERGIAHFRAKAVSGTAEGYGMPAEIFVDLLVRLERFDEAIAASREYFPKTPPANSPSTLQLCQIAGAFGQLRELARERGDLLAYAAGLIQEK